jgi:hypothetical protein
LHQRLEEGFSYSELAALLMVVDVIERMDSLASSILEGTLDPQFGQKVTHNDRRFAYLVDDLSTDRTRLLLKEPSRDTLFTEGMTTSSDDCLLKNPLTYCTG